MIWWEENKKIAKEVKENGYYIQTGMLSNLDLEEYLKYQIPELKSGYSEMAVEKKIYRKRENTPGRLGDALMVTIDDPETAPYVKIDGGLASLYLQYNSVLGNLIGETVPSNTKLLFNYQFYKEGASNSLPFHFDAEIFEGEWEKDYIKLEEGLIPRMVMVVILENENNGKGLKIMKSNGEVIDLDLFPGDILYFDNTSVLHGVPDDLPKKRSMMGFRSFETKPLYFYEHGITGENVIKIDTPYVKGDAVELTTEEAKDMLKEKGWYY